MNQSYFVTGTGTGVGKTLVSAILAEALQADYWKPVQAGYEDGTDSEWVESVLSNDRSTVHAEVYRLKMAASPHIAARKENVLIDVEKIVSMNPNTSSVIIEGAGGLLVPLNDHEFIADLIVKLNIPVILVSRNELGSINHSLLTAAACRQRGIQVAGWIFSGTYLSYEQEIVRWSGFPMLGSIPHSMNVDRSFVAAQAALMAPQLHTFHE